VTDWAVCKLVLGPTVLVKWGEEDVKLFLGKTDDVGGGFFSKLLEVELGNGAEGFKSRCGRGWRRGANDVGVRIDGGGLKGVWVDEGNTGAGRRGGVLWGLGDVDVVGAGASGFEEGEAGDSELELEFGTGGDGGRPGDDGGRCAGACGILETGASGAWIIPSIVGTVEDVVDDLKGGGGVLLIDSVQVGPGGDGDGRGGHFQTVSFN